MESFFSNQICLVTGAGQGIGWAVVLALANKGAQVYFCDNSEKNLQRVKSELSTSLLKDRIFAEYCDVTDLNSVKTWISTIHQKTNKIDIVINNANLIRWQNVADISCADDIKVMQVGYNGMVNVIHVVLPYLQAAGKGYIVNMGSSAGKIFTKSMPASYAAVKAAIDGYTQTLQCELKGSGITIILVRPGAVSGTDFFRIDSKSALLRMPRIADFMPNLTPTIVADKLVRAIEKKQIIVDIPVLVKVFYLLFALSPRFCQFLLGLGGQGRRDYTDSEKK